MPLKINLKKYILFLHKYKLISQFKFLQNFENQFELERIELQTKSDGFSSRANKNRQVEF